MESLWRKVSGGDLWTVSSGKSLLESIHLKVSSKLSNELSNSPKSILGVLFVRPIGGPAVPVSRLAVSRTLKDPHHVKLPN